MNTTLQTLVALQEVDSVVWDLESKIAEFPKIIERLDQHLADQENTLAMMRSRLEEQEKLRRSKELDVESRVEQIKKYQGQLLQVKTNKEYSALLAEINGLKTKNSLTEDDILELMESVERAKKTITETQKEVKQEKVKIAQVKKEKEAEEIELQAELGQEQEKRHQLIAEIEEKALKEYSKLLKLRNGIAVTTADEGGICHGCHVALTPQMFAEVKTGEYLHRCPVCFRFLYWTDNSSSEEEEEEKEE